jgi:O-antigen ligase
VKALVLARNAGLVRPVLMGSALLAAGLLLARQCASDPLLSIALCVAVPGALLVIGNAVRGGTIGLLVVLLATLLSDPFQPEVLPLSGYRISLGKVLVVLAVVCLAARSAACEQRMLLRHALTMPACALAAIALAQVPFSGYPEIALKKSVSLVSLVLMAHVVATLVARSDRDRFAVGVAWTLLAAGVLALVLYPMGIMLDGQPAIDGRASGTLDNPNEWAASCLIAVPWLWAESSARKGRARWLFTGTAAVLAISVVLSFSRGAYLAALITALAMLLIARRLSLRLVVIGIGLTFALDQLFPLASVMDRFTSSFESHTSIDTSISNRATILEAGIQVFLDHPILGCGLGAFPIESATTAHVPFGTDAHNTFLTVACETGLLGVILFVWMLWPLMLRLKRQGLGQRGDRRVRGLLFGFLAMGLMATTVTLHLQGYVWFWIGCAMGLTQDREARAEEAP